MEILTKEEMYAADRFTIDVLGVGSEMLMENAAQAVVTKFVPRLKKDDNILVLAGKGNNGGDGIAVARRLLLLGFKVKLILIPKPDSLSVAAAFHLGLYQKCGFFLQPIENADSLMKEADWIVDAIFGIGIKGKLPPTELRLADDINKSKAKVLSIDIPSGVSADGEVAASAVCADITIAIAYPKISAYQYPTASYYGELVVVDIGVKALADRPMRKRWGEAEFYQTLPKRKENSHKGIYKKALIVGGSADMPCAPIMAAIGCYHSGIGTLLLAIPNRVRTAAALHIPEATYLPCEETAGCITSLNIPDDVDIIGCGPGLSRNPAAAPIVRSLLQSDKPLVLDADALSFLPLFCSDWKDRNAPLILTPHPGEMARLCNLSISEVEANRFDLSKKMAVEYGCYIVLKGAYTITTTPSGEQFVNQSGNSALSKGGSGDILTGMITAFAANEQDIGEAVANAVFAHGAAADWLVRQGRDPREISPIDLPQAFASIFSKNNYYQ